MVGAERGRRASRKAPRRCGRQAGRRSCAAPGENRRACLRRGVSGHGSRHRQLGSTGCRQPARLALSAELVAADVLAWQPPNCSTRSSSMRLCTATGTIRRHPDIPWIKRPEDVASPCKAPGAHDRARAAMLKPGGTLVYCNARSSPRRARAPCPPRRRQRSAAGSDRTGGARRSRRGDHRRWHGAHAAEPPSGCRSAAFRARRLLYHAACQRLKHAASEKAENGSVCPAFSVGCRRDCL